MKQEIQQQIPIDEIKNKEEVRVYRLHLLEQGQDRIFNRIDELEKNLKNDYAETLDDHDKRITLLEECCDNYQRLKWLIIGEAIIILGLVLKNALGL